MVRAIFVGEVIHHSLRASDTGTVYLSIHCRLSSGAGCEAKLFFTEKSANLARFTLRSLALPEDPRLLDPRSGIDHVSFIGRKVLLQREENEGKAANWYLFAGRDSLAKPEQIAAARKAMGIS
jgi:hypothetical protein